MTKHHHKQETLAQSVTCQTTTATNADVPAADNDHNGKSVSVEAIRLCAYQKWEAAGKPTGDGVQFWVAAEQELMEGKLVEGKNEKVVQGGGWTGQREHDRREADKELKGGHVSVDSHYRDNNRMFQNHGDRGHRHGGT